MGENADKFIQLHTKIEDLLKRKLGLQKSKEGFFSLLTKAVDNLIINQNQYEFLLLINRLRNAIIHDKKFLYPHQAIAEPHVEIIKKLKLFSDRLEKPRTIQELNINNSPRIFEDNEPLLSCIIHMKENDYSQIVVHLESEYGLITREDIAKWYEQQINEQEIKIILGEKIIKDITGIDFKDEYLFLPKTATLLALLAALQSKAHEKIAAVLITEHGKNTEEPINIFTQWDFPDIYKEIKEY